MSQAGIPEAYVVDLSLKSRLRKWITRHPKEVGLGSVIVAGSVALIYFVVWVATPREVDVHVEDISWMYLTNVRQREVRHSSGWGHPGNKGFYKEPVFNKNCESRYYGEETYVCGSYTTVYACGKSTCSQIHYRYCNRSVYKTWCDYDYYEWPVVNFEQTSGNTHEVRWSELKPNGPLQRIQNIANYEVNFVNVDDRFQYKPGSLADFRRFSPKDRWRLQVGRIRRHNIEELTKLP